MLYHIKQNSRCIFSQHGGVSSQLWTPVELITILFHTNAMHVPAYHIKGVGITVRAIKIKIPDKLQMYLNQKEGRLGSPDNLVRKPMHSRER